MTRFIPFRENEQYRLVGTPTGGRALVVTTLRPRKKRAARTRRVLDWRRP